MDPMMIQEQPQPQYSLQKVQPGVMPAVEPYVEPEFQATPATYSRTLWATLAIIALLLLGVLVFYNLTAWPVTWFDEGSHLHVPKTLVTDGVYADKSSDGYRYYGPTLGVGPTVMLPIALAFEVGGIGLLQARLVMALYLLATVAAFYWLARQLGDVRFAVIAVALLVTMRGASTLEYGRQVLGEVPGLFFMAAGLAFWFGGKERASVLRLMGAGVLLGLSIVTKSQNLLVIAPALLIGWVANLIYYRAAPQRFFLITGTVTAAIVAIWQGYQVLYLGPSTWEENFALLQAASAGAAFVFSPELMRRSLGELFSLKVFLGMLPIFLGYGMLLALPRSRGGLKWGIIVLLVGFNLLWYVFASIGWIRYAFPGLALTTLFAARLFADLFGAVIWEWRAWGRDLRNGIPPLFPVNLAIIAGVVLALMIAAPLALTAQDIAMPPTNAPEAMAAYMNANVPQDQLVETWEPEMGFLTDHNYHFPPAGLLDAGVGYIWRGDAPPAQTYNFVQEERPPYVLVGSFARWVELYDQALQSAGYELIHSEGGYELFKAIPIIPVAAQRSK
jgi:4-amino-4-deoxy-L-arabinose transferase-like glycosyltransferase